MNDQAPSKTRRVASLGAGLAVASLLGFLLLAVIARWLPPEQNAVFLAVWGVVFSFGSVIGATEQEIARQSALAHLKGDAVPRSVLQYTGLALVACLLAVTALVVWPGGLRVFGDSAQIAVLTGIAVVGFGAQFLLRGIFLGRGEAGRYVYLIVAEAAIRLLAMGVLYFLVQPAVLWAVLAVILGCFGWLPLSSDAVQRIDPAAPLDPWRSVLLRWGALAGGNGLSSLVLTGFSSLVTLIMGAQGMATLFAVVTLSRIPLVLLSPVQAMAVPLAVEAIHSGRVAALASLQKRGALLFSAAAVVLALGGYVLGPWAVSLFAGAAYQAPGWLVAVALGASAFMAGALLQAAVFIALERHIHVVTTWGSSVGATVLVLVTVPGDRDVVGMTGFVTASLVAYLVSGVLLVVALRRHQGGAADPAEDA